MTEALAVYDPAAGARSRLDRGHHNLGCSAETGYAAEALQCFSRALGDQPRHRRNPRRVAHALRASAASTKRSRNTMRWLAAHPQFTDALINRSMRC